MNNKQPIAYVICGFIGAGKTTFARKLEHETKAIRITKDEWIIKIFGNKITSDKNFERYDKNITELATDIAFKSKNPTKDSFEISEEMFNSYLKYWQAPDESENVKVVKSSEV